MKQSFDLNKLLSNLFFFLFALFTKLSQFSLNSSLVLLSTLMMLYTNSIIRKPYLQIR